MKNKRSNKDKLTLSLIGAGVAAVLYLIVMLLVMLVTPIDLDFILCFTAGIFVGNFLVFYYGNKLLGWHNW